MTIIKLLKKITTFLYTLKIKKTCAKYGKGLKVHHYSTACKNVFLGNNVNFNGMRISAGGTVRIGDNFHSGRNCSIIVQNHNYEGKRIPYDDTYIFKEVTIEDNVWLGNNVIILGGVSIGEGSIIQAGSVVSSSIPPFSIAGGNPCKTFKQRNRDHYLDLKSKGLFY